MEHGPVMRVHWEVGLVKIRCCCLSVVKAEDRNLDDGTACGENTHWRESVIWIPRSPSYVCPHYKQSNFLSLYQLTISCQCFFPPSIIIIYIHHSIPYTPMKGQVLLSDFFLLQWRNKSTQNLLPHHFEKTILATISFYPT